MRDAHTETIVDEVIDEELFADDDDGSDWAGPFRHREELDALIEHYVAQGMAELQGKIDAEPEEECRAAFARATARVAQHYRDVLSQRMDAIWAAHLQRIGGTQ